MTGSRTLHDLLYGPPPKGATEGAEDEADRLLCTGAYKQAASAYLGLPRGARGSEKLAYALLYSGKVDQALEILAPVEGQLSATGQCVRVAAWMRQSGLNDAQRIRRAAAYDELLTILAGDHPPYYALAILDSQLHGIPQAMRDRAVALLERACRLFPKEPLPHLTLDALQERAGLAAEHRVTALKQAFEGGVRAPDVALRLSALHRAMGDRLHACQWMGVYVQLVREEGLLSPAAALPAAELFIHAEQPTEALKVLEAVSSSGADFDAEFAASYLALYAACAALNRDAATSAAISLVEVVTRDRKRSLWSSPRDLYLWPPHVPSSEGPWGPLPTIDGYREDILAVASGPTAGWLRYLLARWYAEGASGEEADVSADDVLAILGDAMDATGHDAAVVAFYVEQRARAKRPNWAALGELWFDSAVRLAQEEMAALALLPDRLAEDPAVLRKFVKGVEAAVRVASPSPFSHDVIEESLSDLMFDAQLHRELLTLYSKITATDQRAGAWFIRALAAQRAGDKSAAIAAYRAVLDKPDAPTGVVLHNLLLLCNRVDDQPLLAELEPRIRVLPDDEGDGKFHRAQLLAMAEKAALQCQPILTPAQVLAKAISMYPPLTSRPLAISEFTLEEAVAFLALLRSCLAADLEDVLKPFDQGRMPLAPPGVSRRGLFGLLSHGLATPHPRTPPGAVTLDTKDDENFLWRFGLVWWHLSPEASSTASTLRQTARSGHWPHGWPSAARHLAREIAAAELREYLNYLAEDRSWPEPDDSEQVIMLLEGLLDQMSVAEGYYVLWLGARSASDWLQRYGYGKKQAANLIVTRAGQSLERIKAGGYPPKPFERVWRCPRSALSLALYEDLLGAGDIGFTARLDGVPWPSSGKR